MAGRRGVRRGAPTTGSVGTPEEIARRPQQFKDAVQDGGMDIAGNAILIDLGSPFAEGKLPPVQMFLLQNEHFLQAAEAPDEPVLIENLIKESLGQHGDPFAGGPGSFTVATSPNPDMSEKQTVIEALRTHYKIQPFRMDIEGLLMPGQSFEDAESRIRYPAQKITDILQLIRDAHLLAYASTTTQSGIGTGFIKNLVITRFDWNKDNKGDNYAPFTLELQMVTGQGRQSGGGGQPQDGGTKKPNQGVR